MSIPNVHVATCLAAGIISNSCKYLSPKVALRESLAMLIRTMAL